MCQSGPTPIPGEYAAEMQSQREGAAREKARAKLIATEFFYWWHNQPGSNTQDGFDDWWDKHGKAL